MDPATIGPLLIVLISSRSDRVATCWLTDEPLSDVSGSGVGSPVAGADRTAAVLVRVLPPMAGSRVTVTCRVRVSDRPRSPSAQTTVVVPVQPVTGCTPCRVTPLGSGSVTTTPRDVDGPLLVTCSR